MTTAGMVERWLQRRCICLVLATLTGLSMLSAAELTAAADKSSEAEAEAVLPGLSAVLPELRKGGYVFYIRHGLTDQSGANDADADFSRCETQRNLSEEGRGQSKLMGIAIRQLGIPIGKVITSPFCRCKDTAQLAFGKHSVSQDLFFAFQLGAQERQRLAGVLRSMLSERPAPGTNTVIVGHTANLKEAANIWPKPEGVTLVFRLQANQGFTPVARIVPEDWVRLATASH